MACDISPVTMFSVNVIFCISNQEKPAGTGEPMRLFHIFPPGWQASVGIVCSIVVIHLLPLEDCPAGYCNGCPAPEDDHKVGIAAVVDKSKGRVNSPADPVSFYTVSNVDPGLRHKDDIS